MQPVELKLKQASAVLDMAPKDLQNLVQFGVIRPRRRRGLFLFDTATLYEAQIAQYLKAALGTPAPRLARFVGAFSEWMKGLRSLKEAPEFVVFKSRVPDRPTLIEVRVPLAELRGNLDSRLRHVRLYRDLPRGRKRPGWKDEFLAALKDAAEEVGDVSPEDILQTVRSYRRSRKREPEIAVAAE
jgi:hypothetical protein